VSQAQDLRARAEGIAAPFPPLLLAAERLASTVVLGEHGRRRPGIGDEFWQYRLAGPSDSPRQIDWRRSARTDVHFVRQSEWQVAQSATLWIDSSPAMQFSSTRKWPSKHARAQVLAMALAVLLLRGGERVGLMGSGLPPRDGQAQAAALAQALAAQPGQARAPLDPLPVGGQAVFMSDFLGELDAVETAVSAAAQRGIRGALIQVLDPEEAAFPYQGRTEFQAPGGTLRFKTQAAEGLRERYLARLGQRQAALLQMARACGWAFSTHITDVPPRAALIWLNAVLGR
jgi:uncharacterized protein (DUF58 family)